MKLIHKLRGIYMGICVLGVTGCMMPPQPMMFPAQPHGGVSYMRRPAPPAAMGIHQAIQMAAQRNGVPANILTAIGMKESHLGAGLDQNMRGDRGHGHGIFQIDDRYHSHFLQSHNWRDPYVNADYAARLLRENFQQFGNWQAAVAAYNAGAGNVRKALSMGLDVDAFTTGRNYSRDVLSMAYGRQF